MRLAVVVALPRRTRRHPWRWSRRGRRQTRSAPARSRDRDHRERTGPTPAPRTGFFDSVPTFSDLDFTPWHAAATGGLAAAFVLLAALPAELLSQVLQENYSRAFGWLAPLRRRTDRIRRRRSRVRIKPWISSGISVALAALILCFADAEFRSQLRVGGDVPGDVPLAQPAQLCEHDRAGPIRLAPLATRWQAHATSGSPARGRGVRLDLARPPHQPSAALRTRRWRHVREGP